MINHLFTSISCYRFTYYYSNYYKFMNIFKADAVKIKLLFDMIFHYVRPLRAEQFLWFSKNVNGKWNLLFKIKRRKKKNEVSHDMNLIPVGCTWFTSPSDWCVPGLFLERKSVLPTQFSHFFFCIGPREEHNTLPIAIKLLSRCWVIVISVQQSNTFAQMIDYI